MADPIVEKPAPSWIPANNYDPNPNDNVLPCLTAGVRVTRAVANASESVLLYTGVVAVVTRVNPAAGARLTQVLLTQGVRELAHNPPKRNVDRLQLAATLLLGGQMARAAQGVPRPAATVTEEPPTPLAANRTEFQEYTDSLRRSMERPATTNPTLSEIMDEMYRPNATVGSGSTADAVRYERATGQPVGGKWHTQKAEEGVIRLERWLRANPTAAASDRAAAENVIRDLRNALAGR